MKTIILSIIQCFIFQIILVAPDANPEPSAITSVHHSLTSQNLEAVLASIDERLRSLDNLHGLRFAAPRWELNVEAHNRKLEALETKLARIETVLELRVDKLTESLSSKILKEELGKEQLSRKIDVIYERLNHRMSYMESRIENNIAKFQSSLDTTLTRTNSQLEHLVKTSGDLENDIMEVNAAVDEGKSILQLINNSLAIMNETGIVESYARHENTTMEVLATCQNYFLSSKDFQEMIRKSLDLVNATRREVQEAVKSIKASAARRPNCPYSEASLDYLIEKVDSMSRKNEGNYQKLDTTIERLHMRQELYQESCHRLQSKEPQIENRIAEILEKILDSLENRTVSMDENYEQLLENLKSHHNYVIRAVGQTTNSVNRLNEQMSHDVKSLHLSPPGSDRIDLIIAHLQELQNQFHELNTSLKSAQTLTPNLSQMLLNSTQILMKIQALNENMTIVVERIFDLYKGITEPEPQVDDASSRILQIFNITETELAALTTKDQHNTLVDRQNGTTIANEYNEAGKGVFTTERRDYDEELN